VLGFALYGLALSNPNLGRGSIEYLYRGSAPKERLTRECRLLQSTNGEVKFRNWGQCSQLHRWTEMCEIMRPPKPISVKGTATFEQYTMGVPVLKM
jgi:hypothetical protein